MFEFIYTYIHVLLGNAIIKLKPKCAADSYSSTAKHADKTKQQQLYHGEFEI